MSIMLSCNKGCGVPIEVSEEQLMEFRSSGAPVDVAHEVCPRDREENPTYRVEVTVTRIDLDGTETVLAKSGGSTEAPSFVTGIRSISEQLNESWQKVHELAPIAESD